MDTYTSVAVSVVTELNPLVKRIVDRAEQRTNYAEQAAANAA